MSGTETFVPKLSTGAHKYSRGMVGVVAGSERYPGAAVLCVGGARVGGAGYVHYLAEDATPKSLVLNAYPDVVPVTDFDHRVNSWVVGPGNPERISFPQSKYLVLDADSMARSNKSKAEYTIILPHEGEAAALGFAVSEGVGREAVAEAMAKQLGVFVVLKGHHTIVASPKGDLLVDKTGGPELACAGSGDVLAGVIASALASWQPDTAKDVQKIILKAVQHHSTAGKLAAKKVKPVTAPDIVKALQRVTH